MGRRARHQCPEGCGREMRADHLNDHLKMSHGYSDENIREYKADLKRDKLETKGGKIFKCDQCSQIYSWRTALQEHVRFKHQNAFLDPATISLANIEPMPPQPKRSKSSHISSNSIICPICEETSASNADYANHHREQHASEQEKHHYMVKHELLDSENDFVKFRDHLAELYCTSLTVRSSRTDGAKKVQYLRCHKSRGVETQSSFRVNESQKEVDACTAYAIVSLHFVLDINSQVRHNIDGKIEVEYCIGHVSHSLSWANIRLTDNQKSLLKKYVHEGLSDDQLISTLRREYSKKDSRLYYVNSQDLSNIRESCQLLDWKLDSNDVESVRIRYDNHDLSDGLVVFNPNEDAQGSGLIVVIATPLQQDWIRLHSQRVVIMDDTHNITRYSLKLSTVLVIDEKDRGLPAAFLISSSVRKEELSILMEEIKRIYPDFAPSEVMTDEAMCFWNAYQSVFPIPAQSTTKRLCRFHIYQSWSRKVKEDVAKEHQHSILSALHKILKEPRESAFRKRVAEFLTLLEHKGCHSFAEYFNGYYMNRIEQWATFIAPDSVARTSMYAESWHSRLKKRMGKKKGQMRLDELVEVLLQTIADIDQTHEIEDERKSAKSCPRRQASHKNHRAALKLYHNNQHLIKRRGDSWTVEGGKDSKEWIVSKGECRCGEVNVHCILCHVCPYAYLCSCLDQKSGIACVHAHAVAIYEPFNDEDDINEEEDYSGEFFEEYETPTELPTAKTTTHIDFPAQALLKRENNSHLWGEIRKKMDVIDNVSKQLVKQKDGTPALERLNMLLNTVVEAAQKVAPVPITLASRKDRTNLVGAGPADLPIALKKRTEILKSRRRQKRNNYSGEEREHCEEEVAYCAICFKEDPQTSSKLISWLHCHMCSTWVHKSCTKGSSECVSNDCGGKYKETFFNDLQSSDDDEEVPDADSS